MTFAVSCYACDVLASLVKARHKDFLSYNLYFSTQNIRREQTLLFKSQCSFSHCIQSLIQLLHEVKFFHK